MMYEQFDKTFYLHLLKEEHFSVLIFKSWDVLTLFCDLNQFWSLELRTVRLKFEAANAWDSSYEHFIVEWLNLIK